MSASLIVVAVFALVALVALRLVVDWQTRLTEALRHDLEDPDVRDAVVAELEGGAAPAYRARMQRALDRISDVLGTRLLFSLHGFGLCLALAVAYAGLLFGSGWLFGSPSALLELSILPDVPGWRRLLVGLAAVGGWSGVAWVVHRAAGERGARRVTWVVVAVGVAVAGYVACHVLALGWRWPQAGISGPATAVGALYGGVAGGVGLLALGLSGHARPAGRLAIVIWLAAAALSTTLDPHAGEEPIALVLLALPACNAIFDWLSWAASRALLRALADPETPLTRRRLVGHCLLDLLAAVLLLLGLAASMPLIIEAFALGTPGDALFDLEPWPVLGQGRWLVVILISTLVPTLIHTAHLFASALELRRSHEARVAMARRLDGSPDRAALRTVARFVARRQIHTATTVAALAGLLVFSASGLVSAGGLLFAMARDIGESARTADGWLAITRSRIRRIRDGLGQDHLSDARAFDALATAYDRSRLHPDASWALHWRAAELFYYESYLLRRQHEGLSGSGSDDARRTLDAQRSRAVDRARRALSQTAHHRPLSPRDCMQVVETASRSDPDSAAGLLRTCRAAFPDDVSLQLNAVGWLFEAGRGDDAWALLDEIRQRFPDYSGLRLDRAQMLLEKGDYAEAEAEASKVLERSPRFGPALVVRGVARLRLGRLDEAIDDLARMTRGGSDDATTQLGLTEAYAARQLDGVELDRETRRLLASVHLGRERWTAARDAAEPAVSGAHIDPHMQCLYDCAAAREARRPDPPCCVRLDGLTLGPWPDGP